MRSFLAGVLLAPGLAAQAGWQRIEAIGQHYYAATAYDAARQRLVLFGGTFSDAVTESERTWLWDGSQWSTPGPATQLPKLYGAAMAYDAARQRTVLFGGESGPANSQTWHADTWEWDGTNWLPTAPATHPAARAGHRMIFDAVRSRTLLFGGSGPYLNFTDTWEWDGTNWTARSPSSSPTTNSGFAMAYDPVRNRTVLFGGSRTPDTWEWDGSNWALVAATPAPTARYQPCLAFDPTALSVLMFGGVDGSGALLDDLWQWNGASWQAITATVRPAGRYAAAAEFDPVHNAFVVFGGIDATRDVRSDTWDWAGGQWTERVPDAAPSEQEGIAMAHDAARDRTVVFGGYGRLFTSRDQTWEFDGVAWRQAHPATTPPAREEAGMAFDALRQQIVLFGGSTGGGSGLAPAATWLYDGVDWQLRQPAVQPSARQAPAMTFDPQRGRVLLFGGGLSDTWEWDGNAWTQRAPAHVPPARFSAGLAYDALRRRAVLFGGWSGTWVNDTWEWDGTDWQQRTPATAPPPRQRMAMAYDAARERVVLFGGEGVGQARLGDTWEWDGVDWRQRNPAPSPPGCCCHAMVFDPARARIVVYGGNSYTALHSTTWTYATPAPATVTPFGSGCPGSAGTPVLSTAGRAPWLGDSWTVRGSSLPATGAALFAIGLSDAQWNATPLPLSLTGLGMPGCALLVSPDVLVVAPVSGGGAALTIAIPSGTGLIGLTVFHQLAVTDPAANTAGIAVSAALRSRLGLR